MQSGISRFSHTGQSFNCHLTELLSKTCSLHFKATVAQELETEPTGIGGLRMLLFEST